MMFKASLSSDQQMEYQIKERISFMRFLGGQPPYATMPSAGLLEALFERFNAERPRLSGEEWANHRCEHCAGARQRNPREENAAIKGDELPEGWENNPAVRRQKDTDGEVDQEAGPKP